MDFSEAVRDRFRQNGTKLSRGPIVPGPAAVLQRWKYQRSKTAADPLGRLGPRAPVRAAAGRPGAGRRQGVEEILIIARIIS